MKNVARTTPRLWAEMGVKVLQKGSLRKPHTYSLSSIVPLFRKREMFVDRADFHALEDFYKRD